MLVEFDEFQYYINWYKEHHFVNRIPLLSMYFLYKLLRQNVFKNNTKIITTNGFRMKILENDSEISQELKIFKTHEPLGTEIIKQNVKKGSVCFDIGCNLGYYALLESEIVGKNGQVISFEPSPTNFKCFKENLELNQISNVLAYEVAIGDMNSSVKFLVSTYSNWSRVLEVNSSRTEGHIITVPLFKLDTFVSENKIRSVDFIRMDMEGYEYNAIEGMKDILKQFKPDIFMVVHFALMGIKKTTDFLSKLKNCGYEIKYYVPRLQDIPWVSNFEKDVQRITLDDLIKNLPNKIIINFHLYLIVKK